MHNPISKTPEQSTDQLAWPAYLGYASINLPLAMVLLPVYVYLADHYARNTSLSLATIGVVFLITRCIDALFDPLIGMAIDRWRDRQGFIKIISYACAPLAVSFWFLSHPSPSIGATQLSIILIFVYLSFSCATIALNSWGACWAGSSKQATQTIQIKLNATREAIGLIGVLIGATLPGVLGIGHNALVVIALLALALGLMWSLPTHSFVIEQNAPRLNLQQMTERIFLPFQSPAFNRLLAVFAINGIAASIPSVLVIFFVKDVLRSEVLPGVFLLAYFAAAALSMPFWVQLATRFGLTRTWAGAMCVSLLAFMGAGALGAGDEYAFGLICLISGFALGAELAIPGALLSGVIRRAGHTGQAEGAYFGLWTSVSKINLAVAAGVALPLVEYFGYSTTSPTVDGVLTLKITYAIVPCVLKLCAAIMLMKLAQSISPNETVDQPA